MGLGPPGMSHPERNTVASGWFFVYATEEE